MLIRLSIYKNTTNLKNIQHIPISYQLSISAFMIDTGLVELEHVYVCNVKLNVLKSLLTDRNGFWGSWLK